MKKKYYKYIDIVRILACLAVLFYHLNILKGGYLAVCTFFVLSGYFACVSLFKKEKISLKEYYFNRLKQIYLPLIVVLFITIAILSLFPDIFWFNLRPETLSIIFGYNNFWQINANLDYFARNVSSPMMHLWYVGILLQFELIFPFLFLVFKKLGEKTKKTVPVIITLILSIGLTIYFGYTSVHSSQMVTYYNTLSRLFSLMFGVFLGFVHSYFKPKALKLFNKEAAKKIIFTIYLFLLIILYVMVPADSKYFAIAMIITTLMTCRLIHYGVLLSSSTQTKSDNVIKHLASKSYGIYLVQYPIIYLFQSINMNYYVKIVLIILLTILVGCILHYLLDFNKKSKVVKTILRIILLFGFAFGIYKFVTAPDYSEEMKALEEELAKNELIIKEKQEQYLENMQKLENDWLEKLQNLENGEKDLANIVKSLPVIGIGDSVMLGAVNNLYAEFTNGYFDAAISRTAWVANDIILSLKNSNRLGDPIIINLGANGDCSKECKDKIMSTIGDRKVFWVNTTNDISYNKRLSEYAEGYTNLHVIDWYNISLSHPNYFVADKIHLTAEGKIAYTEAIYNSLYEVYLEEYKKQIDEMINQHEQNKKNKISFYGNDLLLNVFNNIEEEFSNAKFTINDYTYKTIFDELKDGVEADSLTNKIVLILDSSSNLTHDNYTQIIELLDKYELYIVTTDKKITKELLKIETNNLTIINFYEELLNNDGYLMNDKVHLTSSGNTKLSEMIIMALKKDN